MPHSRNRIDTAIAAWFVFGALLGMTVTVVGIWAGIELVRWVTSK